ncbi:universal stress protein [Bradyrhizobium sp. U87765 SZCCT0131]|uniref:universal stress protein n=1 Tax=unclassified Bradyrhizobium TaxID=2631580 RepID=UPI001BAC240A|nr:MULTISPECIES: universal stress protein [unclassified Bradyrhizobium]MBR1217766.1 universal stress protein [Bradyrhizobium sp. U87765 SZCCT0131]MBR1261288.1 universal stress protein [Bradyrhizobium sp. U87765 SZCCT0134]MBR1303264.1 universal stress protein [Bradyrhizobium sp. U87765 SZCCT0110]MBR1318870.1 universal stress protein [Bradyrhizobium sp. U87765 SZCCT0109]MBR1347195.1 universal stress protein [Bradyrhizobium sp. U87765 SZCCT0048]
MIKDIIVKLEREPARNAAVCGYAASIAEAFEAHIAGIAFAHAGIPPFVLADVPADVIQKLIDDSAALARKSADQFQQVAERSRLSAERQVLSDTDVLPSEAFAEMARRFDLAVVMQSDGDKGVHNDLLIETALFDAGRPLMLVPYIQQSGMKLDRVVCCWDGGRPAARAIHDAMPLLKRARVVELLIVANDRKPAERDARGLEIGRHLARHGLKVEVEVMPAAGIGVADVIVSHIADSGADLLVMGGYGHSRLREIVLGGATRDILKEMTVPVLMSH